MAGKNTRAVERATIYHPSFKTAGNRLTIGLRFEGRTVYLYELAADDAVSGGAPPRLSDYLFQVCEEIRSVHFPDRPLSAINWIYRSGFAASRIRIRMVAPSLGVLRFANMLALHHEPGALEDYQANYYREDAGRNAGRTFLSPPGIPRTYYVTVGFNGRFVMYFEKSFRSREQKIEARESGYAVLPVRTAAFVALLKQHCPRDYARTPLHMEKLRNGGAGLTLRQPAVTAKLYCGCDTEGVLRKMDVVEAAESALGLLDMGFDILPVRVRRGAQKEALDRHCSLSQGDDGRTVFLDDGVATDRASGIM